ncbi:hypothetical protein TeGR_g8827 [Tetraparma gracilis]|uniref:DUF4149 domain-containing protein n=1 Tax=Tetraparma gracilis TaxID=2962635 RepID=A0ABQ6M4Y8_9STRA|nr:hypothetical protein TeGR_g8827 [Tetraparma gracilis]
MLALLALIWNGALNGAMGCLFLFKPSILLSFFYTGELDSFPAPDAFLTSICQYFGVTLLTLSFLYLHYIPFADKRGPGLRMAMMLSLLYIAVALTRFLPEDASPSASTFEYMKDALEGSLGSTLSELVGGAKAVAPNKQEAAIRTLVIQGFTFALSLAGMLTAPKKAKKD